MSSQHLKQILQNRAEQEIPETMDLRNQIHRAIQAERPRRAGLHLTRYAAVLLLLLTATAAYAIYQTVKQPDPGIEAVKNDNLVVEIDETQRITLPETAAAEGIDVTLDYAYADANRIAVAYNVTGDPAEAELEIYANPTLTDGSGRQYAWLTEDGYQVVDATTSSASGIMSFDASVITDAPETLDLTLRLEVAYTSPELRGDEPARMVLAGMTTFEFSLPFNPGAKVAVEQTASAADLDVEVKQVVIAPSLTRVDVCYDPTTLAGDNWLSWEAIVSLEIDGEMVLEEQAAQITGFRSPDAPCRSLTIREALVGRSGEWTMTIHAFHNWETNDSQQGEWIYRFTVEQNSP